MIARQPIERSSRRRTKRRLALEEWGDGLPVPLVMFAQEVALSVEAVTDCCDLVRDRSWGGLNTTPTLPRGWIGSNKEECWLTPPGVVAGDVLGIGASNREKADLRSFVDEIESSRTMSKSEWKDALGEIDDWQEVMRESVAMWDGFYRAHLNDLRDSFDTANDDGPPDYGNVLGKPRIAFYFQVTFPCWIEYRISPRILFERVQDGEFESLIKLLHLDVRVLEDRKIRRHYISFMQYGDKVRARRLCDAQLGESLRKINENKVAVLLAALIWKFFARFDEILLEAQKQAWKAELNQIRYPRTKLSFPKLQALFDAASEDMDRGLRHRAFPQDRPDSFAQAVRRNVRLWPEMF